MFVHHWANCNASTSHASLETAFLSTLLCSREKSLISVDTLVHVFVLIRQKTHDSVGFKWLFFFWVPRKWAPEEKELLKWIKVAAIGTLVTESNAREISIYLVSVPSFHAHPLSVLVLFYTSAWNFTFQFCRDLICGNLKCAIFSNSSFSWLSVNLGVPLELNQCAKL